MHHMNRMHNNDFMEGSNFIVGGHWLQMVSVALIVLSFYFTLTFFQHLKTEDQRMVNQSKIAAVICLVLALLIPVLFQLRFFPVFFR